MSDKRLVRSRSNKMLFGVCGGLAHEMGWPAGRVRIAYVVFSIVSVAFPGLLVYLLLWFLMPKSDEW